MFVKLMGVIILCAGGGMAGGAKALDLSKRVNRIRALYEAILIFKNEINFKTAPLCDFGIVQMSPTKDIGKCHIATTLSHHIRILFKQLSIFNFYR